LVPLFKEFGMAAKKKTAKKKAGFVPTVKIMASLELVGGADEISHDDDYAAVVRKVWLDGKYLFAEAACGSRAVACQNREEAAQLVAFIKEAYQL
jgi:hypothetical protein